MADSASEQNVEDVLSSVRRLISQEAPKQTASVPAAESGALVLKSHQRVESTPKAKLQDRSLEERIAELEAAVDDSTQMFEPDGSEDLSQHRPDRIVFTRPRSSETGVGRPRSTLRLSEIALVDDGTLDENDGSDGTPLDESDGSDDKPLPFRRRTEDVGSQGVTEAPIAEDVPTLPRASAEVRPFYDPDDVVARIEARIERGSDDDLPTPVADPSDAGSGGKSTEFDADLSAAVQASVSQKGVRSEKIEEIAPTIQDVDDRTLRLEEPVEGAGVQPVDTFGDAEEVSDQSDAEAGHTEYTPRSRDAVETRILPREDDVVTGDSPNPADAAVAPDLSANAAAKPDAPHDHWAGPEEAEFSSCSRDAVETRILPREDDVAAHDVAEPDNAAGTDQPAPAAALPDEDAVRALVGRLLREEFQGELGERVTHNVRKLVRSEILRLMESRDLD